ncbi:MAG: substrate-binding domain-containing protein, partial [Thermoanaerobaculia bacterium]
MRLSAPSLALSLFAALLGCDAGGEGGAGGGAATGGGASGPAAARKVHPVKPGTPLKLAFVTNNASDFWNIARKGIERAQKELGIQVDMKTPVPESFAGQVRVLEDLESQGYHGIAISALHPSDMNRQLNRIAARTNLITHDSDAPGSNRLVYIGTLNYEAGRALGREIVKLFPQGAQG